jgi:hypothetical protein
MAGSFVLFNSDGFPKMKFSRLICFGIWLACSLSPAGYLAMADVESVSIRFSALAWDRPIHGLHYYSNGKHHPLVVPNGAPGSKNEYSGPPVIEFYTKETGDEGQIYYRSVAEIDSTPHGADLLLLFFKDEGADSGFRIMPVADNTKAFGRATFNFSNFTPNPIMIRAGNRDVGIEPGMSETLEPRADSADVSIQMATRGNGDTWRLVYRSRWAVPDDRRVWVFLYGDGDGRPAIRRFYQQSADLDE